MRICASLILILFGCAASLASDAAIELSTADGSTKKPLELNGAKAAVLIFYLHDCPICNTYAPELERIRVEYEAKGFTFYIVQTDPALKAADAKKHATEYGFKCAVLLDPANRLAKLCGAAVTPEAAIVGANAKVLYRGRIDDLFADYGKQRAKAITHDLRAALDAVAEGKPAPPAGGAPVGCAIPPGK